MRRAVMLLSMLGLITGAVPLCAAEKSPVEAFLRHPIVGPHQSLAETQTYLEARLPPMPAVTSAAAWEKEAERMRKDMLNQVVFRGEAERWRDTPLKVQWLEAIPGGPGYRIKKLRYEALPGFWVPALLYEPEKLTGKVPVILNVNGHDAKGKAAPYKQIRCVNLAKRGMLALNVEWLNMGQLRAPGYAHGRMNQMDLCGTSGLAPFYLDMRRGLDLLLGLEHADPSRAAVTGLSGGGWQTIFLSALDPRVTLSDPVAGYSGDRTRVRHFKDLGDSEQTPCDMATVADYTHLTAMRAPRPTLLTFNDKDDCCFESGYALPPLLDAARPIFRLYGKESALRSHVNSDPGTHNYEKDNRQAFYRMVGDFFYPGDHSYSAVEIPCEKEVKSADQLNVPLPHLNADFHSLALALSKKLPQAPDLPGDRDAARRWQQTRRDKLRALVRARPLQVRATQAGSDDKGGTRATYWRLALSGHGTADAWTVPAVELVRGEPKGTTVLIADGGRAAVAAKAERLLKAGQRVVAFDPWYFGESKIETKDWLFALLVATVGDRPLGLEASQVAAVARWAREQGKTGPVTLAAVGPRSSTVALVAAAADEGAVGKVELHGAWGSLKEVIEKDHTVEQMPEMFCFGLLEAFDVKQLAALVAPRPVVFADAGPRARAELAGLKTWYRTLGHEFQPLP